MWSLAANDFAGRKMMSERKAKGFAAAACGAIRLSEVAVEDQSGLASGASPQPLLPGNVDALPLGRR
jgi:hypothetical protein